MKIKLLLIVAISIFGFISCNSDRSTPKTFIINEAFSLQPPEIIRSKNQEILTWDQFSKPKAPYNIDDALVFHNTDMAEIQLVSSCSQEDTTYKTQYLLAIKNKYSIRELLPLDLVKAIKSSLITCQFNFVVKNANQSSHEFSMNSIIIDPNNWKPNVEIEILGRILNTSNLHFDSLKNSTENLTGNSQNESLIQSSNLSQENSLTASSRNSRPYIKWNELQNIELNLSQLEASNHLSLECKSLKPLQLFHPFLEVQKLDWNQLKAEIERGKNSTLFYMCRFFISHKVGSIFRPLGWTQEFKLLSPQNPIQLKKTELILKNSQYLLTIPKQTKQDLYVRVLKADLKKAFSIVDGFHLFKSNLINYFEYNHSRRVHNSDFRRPEEPINYHSSPNYWVHNKSIHYPRIRSTSKHLKLIRENHKEWVFKAAGSYPLSFAIDFVRVPHCQNVQVEFTRVQFKSDIPMTFHADMTLDGIQIPLDRITFYKKYEWTQQLGITKNKTLSQKYFNLYPELKTGRNKTIDETLKLLMLKNEYRSSPCLD